MTVSDDTPFSRRADDARLNAFERKIDRIEQKVDDLRDTLADPDKTMLGKTLVGRANTNAHGIERLADRVDSLEGWRDQMRGSVALARVVQTVLAIFVAALTIYALIGQRP